MTSYIYYGQWPMGKNPLNIDNVGYKNNIIWINILVH